MQRLSVILNVILFVLVGVLFYLHFSPDAASKKVVATASEGVNSRDTAASGSGFKMAYVDIDSLEAHYEYFKQKKSELEKRENAVQNELNSEARSIQSQMNDLQQKVNSNAVTESDAKLTYNGIMQKQQALEQKKQNMGQQLMNQQAKFMDDLKGRIDDFLGKYNADKRFSYILSYSSQGPNNILYKDKSYNITNEVIDGLNAAVKGNNK